MPISNYLLTESEVFTVKYQTEASLRPRPKFEMIWVCESPTIILYSGVLIT